MQTHTFKTYGYDELSDEAKEKAIEECHEINVDDSFWHEFIIDDAKEIGSLMGIKIKNIYFSGFWSQGDGACFEGDYDYKKGGAKAVKEYAPQDKELHRIARELQAIQKVNFYRIAASVRQEGHYNHEFCTAIDVSSNYERASYETEDTTIKLLRDFMRWIYRSLEKEYEYQVERDQIKNTILANSLQFNLDGTFNKCY